MIESKYAKYIVTEPKPNVPPKEWGSGDIGTDRVTRLIYMDNEFPKGAFYLGCLWLWKKSLPGQVHASHSHDFDEVLAFFGTNPEDPSDLCGEIELWLGDEKHLLTKSCAVFVPKGLRHCPLIYNRIDRPIFHFSTGHARGYAGQRK